MKKTILLEVSDIDKTQLYAKSNERKPFNRELMKQAIESGLEVGLSFKSDNEEYTMPTTKYRIIWPVVMGTSKKGNLVIRGYHIIGQSERKAIETGVRSAEVQNEWRLFNAKNIKGMWLTGRSFADLPSNYNPQDKSMNSIIVSFNKNKAISKRTKKVSPETPETPIEPETEE